MQQTLANIHRMSGYVIFLVVLAVGIWGFAQRKSGRDFEPGPFSFTMILVDLQVTLGLIVYVVGKFWESSDAPLLAYVHPIVMLVALGVGHAMLGRARREQMVADAYARAGSGLLAATVLILIGIGVASAA